MFQFVHSSLSVLLLSSLSVLLLSSKILPSLVFLSFSKKSSPSFLFFPPSLYKQEEKVSPLLCPIVVQGGTGCLTSAG
jgi:hypothetical protein